MPDFWRHHCLEEGRDYPQHHLSTPEKALNSYETQDLITFFLFDDTEEGSVYPQRHSATPGNALNSYGRQVLIPVSLGHGIEEGASTTPQRHSPTAGNPHKTYESLAECRSVCGAYNLQLPILPAPNISPSASPRQTRPFRLLHSPKTTINRPTRSSQVV